MWCLQNDLDGAEKYYSKAIELHKQRLGDADGDLELALPLNNMAFLLMDKVTPYRCGLCQTPFLFLIL